MDKEINYNQLNSLLADPQFANWYFNKMSDKCVEEVSINEFVDILQSYNNEQFE